MKNKNETTHTQRHNNNNNTNKSTYGQWVWLGACEYWLFVTNSSLVFIVEKNKYCVLLEELKLWIVNCVFVYSKENDQVEVYALQMGTHTHTHTSSPSSSVVCVMQSNEWSRTVFRCWFSWRFFFVSERTQKQNRLKVQNPAWVQCTECWSGPPTTTK